MKAPNCLADKNFVYLHNLDAAGWLRELQKCACWLHDAGIRERNKKAGAPKVTSGDGWSAITEPGELTYKEDWQEILVLVPDALPGVIAPRAVRDITNGEQKSLGDIEEPTRLFKVSLRAPNHVIKKEFEAALREARKDYPTAARKTGRPALNDYFDQLTFTKWINNKIVPYATFLDWNSNQQKKVSDAQFGKWIGQSSTQVSAAKRALNEAIASMPMLLSQIEDMTATRARGFSLK